MIGELDDRISALVDRDDDSDWDDVQRRVRRLVDRKRPSRRVVALAAVVILLAIAVGPALAIERGLLDRFRGAPPPPAVTDELTRRSDDFPGSRPNLSDSPLGRLNASEARGIIALDTPLGPLRLWAVPTETGEVCTYTQVAGRGRGPMCAHPSAAWPLSFAWASIKPGYALLDGRAHSDIVSIAVRFADGSVEPLPFVDSYFIAVINLDRKPAELVSRRRANGRITESSLELPPPNRRPAAPRPAD